MTPLYLAGYDGSRASRAAVSFAARLAEATGAEVLVVDVYETAAHVGVRGVALPGADLVEADIRRAVERRLEELTEPAIQRIAHPAASAAEGLHRLAEDRNAALVVVGRTHRGHIGRHTRGSVAGRLLHGLHCPLAVVPDGVMPTPRTIAVGYDDSPEAQAALTFATDLAERLGARLVLAGVAEPGVYAHPEISPDAWGRLWERRSSSLEDAATRLRGAGPDVTCHLMAGDAAHELLDFAEDGIDMLVLGSRGFGPLHAAIAGSVSSRVADGAPCPVIVVPRTADAASRPARDAGGAVGVAS
jgi:nucleotide-binding universal stress UspA family protein